uniref:Cytidyltransferase-like domain-containing protein n=1 Tax=Pinguiococcus pyrenoidosus TaxID=172671 RepID=A0A7R9U1C6_9STRA
MVVEARDTGQFSEVWILPVYAHMFDAKRKVLASFSHRMELCRRNFEHLSTESCVVRVLGVEKDVYMAKRQSARSLRVGTADVLDYLSERHPEKSFSFLMGADTYRDLVSGKWRRSEELLRRLSFVVFRRGSDDATLYAQGRCQDTFLDSKHLTDISSTAIRDSLDLDFLQKNLRKEVLDYILRHHLYSIGRQRLHRRRAHYWRYAAGVLGMSVAAIFVYRWVQPARGK